MQTQDSQAKSLRILVVEDEGLIALDIAKRLESLGHVVVGTVSTAEEAIESAAEAELVLMDIRIDGDRDGIEAASEIRKRFHLPVIFLTAHADRSTLERAKTAAPYGYMVKPMGPATLQASIEMAAYKHATELKLEEREAWLNTTLQSAGEAILAADARGNMLLMNAAAEALTGYGSAEAKGLPLHEVLPLRNSSTGEPVRELEALAMVRNAPIPLDPGIEAISRTGDRRAVDGLVAPVRTSSCVAGVVLTLHDARGQRWQEQRLLQSQRVEAAAKLAAGVAADYSLFLSTIRARTGYLLAQFGEYPPARQAIEEIHQAATQADQITQRLGAFGARQAPRTELMSVNALIRKATRLIESVAGPKLKVAIDLDSGIGKVLADSTQLEQALMTVVMHAVSVSSDGKLHIKTHLSGVNHGESQLAISLTYPAHEEEAERLFDPLRQGGDDSLSLALAQSIVGEQGGLMIATGVAEGTCIQITLPVAGEKPTASESNITLVSVLLVEGRERVRTRLHNIAEAAGYNLLEAASIDDAVALGEMWDRPVDVLVARELDATAILERIAMDRQPRQVLRVVDRAAKSAEEIENPFTEQAFIERLNALDSKARRAISS